MFGVLNISLPLAVQTGLRCVLIHLRARARVCVCVCEELLGSDLFHRAIFQLASNTLQTNTRREVKLLNRSCCTLFWSGRRSP